MFNPQPRLEALTLADGRRVIVADDVLAHPRGWVDIAAEQAQRFVDLPSNGFPGPEWPLGEVVDGPLAEFFAVHVRAGLGFRRTLSTTSRLSLATRQPHELRPLQRVPHRDRLGAAAGEGVAACVLYLFDDAALGGTSFYAPRRPLAEIEADFARWNTLTDAAFTGEFGAAPAYQTRSNAHFELLHVAEPRFNRAVFYDGGLFHCSHITEPERLSADPRRGRLTLNGFFLCRRSAA
jgi:hypothetical protein